MFKTLNWMSGLALASSIALVGLPGTKLESRAAEAKTPLSTIKIETDPKLITRNQSSGRFKVVYEESEDPFSTVLMQADREQGFFQGIGDLITAEIQLPRNITIVLQDCGQANAYYRKDNHSIIICNELTKESYQEFKQAGYEEQEALESALYTSIFFFYHEIGHMLIHELDLPIVGREEDVADQFSAFFLLSNDSSQDKSISGKILLSAARLFNLESKSPAQGDYQNEHGLNQQRFYNLGCILYGKAPETYQQLISSLDYPESRAASCQQESKKMFDSWQRLLQPHLGENYGG